jgi:hypothetical protein
MRRAILWWIGLIPVIAVGACGAGGGAVNSGQQVHTYRDPAGWTIEFPAGWHTQRFSGSRDVVTSAGVQLSNLRLPPPALVPGYPIQVNGGILGARGAGLIIATDTDPKISHGPVAVPPLPAFDAPNGWKYWNAGSASAGSPYIETMWFRAHSVTYIASAKIGPKATSGDLQAIAAIIHSLR